LATDIHQLRHPPVWQLDLGPVFDQPRAHPVREGEVPRASFLVAQAPGAQLSTPTNQPLRAGTLKLPLLTSGKLSTGTGDPFPHRPVAAIQGNDRPRSRSYLFIECTAGRTSLLLRPLLVLLPVHAGEHKLPLSSWRAAPCNGRQFSPGTAQICHNNLEAERKHVA
jgi:hypothetical protein